MFDKELSEEDIQRQIEEDLGGSPESPQTVESPVVDESEAGDGVKDEDGSEDPVVEDKSNPTDESDDFSLFGDEEDVQPNEAVQNIAKELGIDDIQTEEDLLTYIKSIPGASSSESAFVNDEIKELNDYVKNGGSLFKAREAKMKVVDLKDDISRYEGAISDLTKVSSLTDASQMRQFMERYYRNFMGMAENDVSQAMGDIDRLIEDDMVGLLRGQIMTASIQWRNDLQRELSERQGQLKDAEAAERSLIDDAVNRKKAADAAFSKALETFSDPDGKMFTRRARMAAQTAYNTPVVNSEIPKGIAEVFFMTDGKLDTDKMLRNMSTLINGAKKIEMIEKRIKSGAFKSMKDLGGGTMRRGTAPRATETKSGDDLGTPGTQRRGKFSF